MVEEKKPSVVFLMETRLRTAKMEIIRGKLGFFSMLVVDLVGKNGGLALLWKEEVEVEVQNFSMRHINALV